MKDIINKICFFLAFMLLVVGCTDDFDEINSDPKNFTLDAVTQSEYPLFAKRAMYGPNYLQNAPGPFQLIHSLFTDIYANYFSTTHPNFDSDQFILDGRWLNGGLRYFYTQVAPNIKYAEDAAAELGFNLENAIMKVWRVYAYHRVTDMWGPIVYSNFGNLENNVPYDSQEDIYNDFFISLDEAVKVLKDNAGKTSFLEGNDVIYGGSVDHWLKFANTLRLRLAMRVKYVDPARSKTEAEKAVSDGVMTDNDDNAIIETNINFRNPYNVITQWGEFRISADIESILKGYHDPRIADYAAEAKTPDTSDDPEGLTFNWEGMRNGHVKSTKQGTPFNEIASDMAAPFKEAGVAGPNVPVMRAAEAYFLRAEGALEGWNMGGGTAQTHYEMGIATSMGEYGYSTDLSGNDYVSSTNVPAAIDGNTPPVSTVPIAYDAGASTERQLEQIITQKWIALFPDSEEAFAERRRTGYPTLYDRLNSLNPNIPADQIPKRMTYISSEYSDNGDAVQDAINNLLGGADQGITKLWWDKKN